MKKSATLLAALAVAALFAGGCAKDKATCTDADNAAMTSECGSKDGKACTKDKAACCGASKCAGDKAKATN